MLKVLLLLLVVFTLELENKWFVVSTNGVENFDPSGLTFWKNNLLTVSDKSENCDKIYKLSYDKENYAPAKPFILLNKKNMDNYRSQQKFRVDLEGITTDGQFLYVCDERNRNILKINDDGQMQKLAFDFQKYNKDQNWNPFSGMSNAGFEGISYDKTTRKMYVINERMYRHIYEISQQNIVGSFDVPGGKDLPRYDGKYAIYPDFSGAYCDKYLYVIYRNEYKILCIDPQKKCIVSSAYYGHITKKIYNREDPFGLVEGIAMTPEKIFLIMDNNGTHLKNSTTVTNATLLQLKRPKGF
ncbi:esterase-like activity of phytase family protein [Candidatus Uabimicrobium sp. HlEnr_7]|uniref:esterase-like activity of phytase family protein n=1 Tax=Candidatus Uabimicrobium helgolandensis TaxID=3095367 RepID=UPI00355650E7